MRAAAMAPSASRRIHAPAPAMAMSISRRGVKRRYFAAERGCGGGSRIETRISPGSSAGPAGPAEQCLDGDLAPAAAPGDHGARLVADERRHGIGRRRGVADVAAEACPVLDLHAADQLRRLGDGRIGGGQARMPRHGRRGRRGADGEAAVGQSAQWRSAPGCASGRRRGRPGGGPRAAAGPGPCRRRARARRPRPSPRRRRRSSPGSRRRTPATISLRLSSLQCSLPRREARSTDSAAIPAP